MKNSSHSDFTQKFFDAFTIKKEQENFSDIIQSIYDGVTFRGTNLWVLIFAILIASIGLDVNSQAMIVGAMLISPMMGPILGMGISIGINDSLLLRRSLKNLAFAIAISLITSTLYFYISPISEIQSELLARTSPNIWDVLIAFFGGFAGVIAISSHKKGNVIPGVAIATALMPPLCTVGFGIANLRADFILGALYLFFINAVFIAVSAFVVSRLFKFPYKEFPDTKEKNRSIRIIAFVVIITIIPSIYFAYDMLKKNAFIVTANRFIENETNFPENYLLKKNIDPKGKKIILIFGGKTITDEQISIANEKLKQYNIEHTELQIHQGFASLYQNPEILEKNSSYKTQIEQLSLTLEQKEKEIQQSIAEKNTEIKNSAQIFTEIQVLFPQIQHIVIGKNTKISKDTQEEIFTIILFTEIKFEKNIEEIIVSWLKTRINNNNVEIIFYENKGNGDASHEDFQRENTLSGNILGQ